MKMYKYKIIITAGLILLFAGFTDIYFEINKNIELFSKVYKEISFNYVDKVDPEQFMRAGIRGMLSSLDPYTIFIDEKKMEDIDLITNGKYGGIGISIGIRGNHVTIIEVMDGYSAQRQGLRVGDIIIEAADVKIGPGNVDDISTLVKGEPGTSVNMKIVRNEFRDTLEFNILREEVIVKNLLYADFYPENSSNVYLKLSNFSRSASDEIKNALIKLKSEREIKSIILDLRGNPGGLLDIAVDICDKFLEKGKLIVSTKGRDESRVKEYYSLQEPIVPDAELVVLIDGGSASASEIVAGAVQDHDRGVILGTKSFGKGLVQTITPLSYNTSLKITTAKYYTPSGRCIQKIDYSDHNNVITDSDSNFVGEFLTDQKRVVYSKGGISPDTTVEFTLEGRITRELLAKGLFFKFADHYYYSNQDKNLNTISDTDLLNEFKNFTQQENFSYESDAEDHVNLLISDLSDNYKDIAEELNNLKKKILKIKQSDIDSFKDEIIKEIKEELAVRYLGIEGRIIEQLKSDIQFQTALKVLSDTELYKNILHTK